MQQFSTIQLEINNCIATIWLNRPEVHNALNAEMLEELIECFIQLKHNEALRVIVLRGRGKTFCSGADIQWMLQSAHSDSNNLHNTLLAKCLFEIYSCPKPTLAYVHAGVHAGGVGLLSACDIAIANINTLFSIPEMRIGLIPATIMPYVLSRINQHKLKLLMYTASKIDANTAFSFGLIDFVVEDDEFEFKQSELIASILKVSPNAVKEAKKLLTYCDAKPIDEQVIETTIDTLTRIKASDEGKEGLAAYIEKRAPRWVL